MPLSTKMHLRRFYEMLLCLSGYNKDCLSELDGNYNRTNVENKPTAVLVILRRHKV